MFFGYGLCNVSFQEYKYQNMNLIFQIIDSRFLYILLSREGYFIFGHKISFKKEIIGMEFNKL